MSRVITQQHHQSQLMVLDPTLLAATAALLLIGLTIVASASVALSEEQRGWPAYFLMRQSAYVVMGLALAAVAFRVPTQLWQRFGFLLALAALGLLVAVLLEGVGTSVNGSSRWIDFGPARMQVSEPARLALLMYLAGYAVRHRDALEANMAAFIRPLLVVCLACALLLMEPDFGAASVLLASSLGLLFVSGVCLRNFSVVAVVATGVLAALAVSSPYRLRRIISYLNPWDDPYDSDFQLIQSLIAVGRGEWFGVGLGNGVQKLFYLPEAHTDFVFAVLAEELGLAGVAVTLTLYGALIVRGLEIGRRAAQKNLDYQAMLASGITIWLGLQCVINVGVTLGVLPTKGLTLPLLSYGGSSLLMTMIALGILQRVHHETSLTKVSSKKGGGRS
ncbi:MAG: putative lipid II flippase FtsW [Pseudomonadota bacterium]